MTSSKSQHQFMAKESEQKQISSTMPKTSINYKEFEKNYSRQLLLMDCLDWLKDRPYDAKEILDHLEYCSNIEKTDEEPLQTDQVL